MGLLRQKMINDMAVRGLSERTRDVYLHAVVGLVRYYGCSPDRLNAEQVQAYLAYLRLDRKLSSSSCSVAAHGLRFFYHTSLGRVVSAFVIPVPRVQSPLPDILSAQEVARTVEATRTTMHRLLLMTAYGSGLRVSELVALRVDDIDIERATIHIHEGKGMRDRYTVLPRRLVSQLRTYRETYRANGWLFPSPEVQGPITVRSAQRAFASAKRRAGVPKSCGIHALRHAFATHLLEAGTDVHTIQRLLGHRQIASTLRYLHVTDERILSRLSPLDRLRIRSKTTS